MYALLVKWSMARFAATDLAVAFHLAADVGEGAAAARDFVGAPQARCFVEIDDRVGIHVYV